VKNSVLQRHIANKNRSNQLNLSTLALETGCIAVNNWIDSSCEATVVKIINTITMKHEITPITTFKQAETVRTALQKIVENPTKELTVEAFN
jgi:hypothetical protein